MSAMAAFTTPSSRAMVGLFQTDTRLLEGSMITPAVAEAVLLGLGAVSASAPAGRVTPHASPVRFASPLFSAKRGLGLGDDDDLDDDDLDDDFDDEEDFDDDFDDEEDDLDFDDEEELDEDFEDER